MRYCEVGDYLTREEKLEELAGAVSFGGMMKAGVMREVVPNLWGDWVKQRGGTFEGFVRLGNKNEQDSPAIFGSWYSAGLKTGHDAYSFNFSRKALCGNIRTLKPEAFRDEAVMVALYSPYVKEYLHFSRETIQRVYSMPNIFPKPDTENLVICVSGVATKNFSVLMTDTLPSLTVVATCQCFPLFWYREYEVFKKKGFEKVKAVSYALMRTFQEKYKDRTITQEDLFFYVYGVLSSPEYAARFGNDTRRVLARVPMVEDFRAFADAGRKLGQLHVNYEAAEVWPLTFEGNTDDLNITKMRIIERGGEKVIRYNGGLTVSGIPREAWDYTVNGRSALGWIVERYCDKTDGKSGLRNDCNAWGRERGNERYVLELIGRVVTVSVRTMEILRGLPELGV